MLLVTRVQIFHLSSYLQEAALAVVIHGLKARGVARTQIEHSGLRLPAGGTLFKVLIVRGLYKNTWNGMAWRRYPRVTHAVTPDPNSLLSIHSAGAYIPGGILKGKLARAARKIGTEFRAQFSGDRQALLWDDGRCSNNLFAGGRRMV